MNYKKLTSIFLLAIYENAYSSASKVDENELDEVMVSASPGKVQQIQDVDASVEIITQERIQSLSLRSLPEIIQFAAGTGFVKDSGVTSSVNLRGSSNNQTLILVDGLRRTGKYGTTDLTGITMENIQKIEIIRGPMSALYGAEAIGGIINVITKKPGDKFAATGSMTYGQAERGQRDTFIERASVTAPEFHGIKSRFSAELFNKNALQLDKSVPTTTLKDIDRYYVNYAGAYDFSDTRKLKWTGEILSQEDTGSYANGLQGKESEDRHQFNMFYDDLYSWGSTKLQGSYGQTVANVGRDATNASLLENTQYHLGQIEGFVNYFVNKDLTWTFGTGGRFQDVFISTYDRSRFPGAQSRNVFHALSQFDWHIMNDVKLLGGLRYDSFSDFGDTLNPRATLSWSPGDFDFRAGYGTAFKAPEFVNMYTTFTRTSMRTIGPRRITSISQINGNPNLAPENSESLEIAGKYSFKNSLINGSFESIGHITWYDNLIQYVAEATQGTNTTTWITPGQYQNTQKARVKGVELIFNLGYQDLYNLTASYEFLDAEDTVTHIRLLDRASHAFRFQNIFHVLPNVDFALNGRFYDGYVGQNASRAYETANYQVYDTKLTYSPTKWLSTYVGMDNFLNTITPYVMGSQGTPNDPGGRYYYTGFNLSY